MPSGPLPAGMSPTLRYRIRPSTHLHWAGWDGEFVVFNEGSGQTHQLDPLRALVLDLLQESPRTWQETLDGVGQALALDAGADAAPALQRMLDEFQRLGLVDTLSA